jgi:hypothetical protein
MTPTEFRKQPIAWMRWFDSSSWASRTPTSSIFYNLAYYRLISYA